MYTVRIVLLLLQALTVVEAANVKWTLHKSCYKTKDGQGKDEVLEDAMIDAVSTSKAWAKRGSEKLTGLNGLFKKTTKESMQPLLGKGSFDDNVKDVIDRFNKLGELEGPIGKNGPANARYDASADWDKLKQSDDHYLNFVIVCRPELKDETVPGGEPGKTYPYDVVREKQYNTQQVDLKTMTTEENDVVNWEDLQPGPGRKIMAITQVDAIPSRRLRIPETITFHPLFLQYQKTQKFSGWTDELFTKVTANNAKRVYSDMGSSRNPSVTIVPADGLLDASFVRTIFHELFHLSAFGGMVDSDEAYGWVNNVKNQSRANPDLFAIIAAIIELLNRDGDKYKVDKDGVVTKGR